MVENPTIIIQARMNSERLPGKVLMTIGGKPLIGILLGRLLKANLPIVVATSVNRENDVLADYVTSLNIPCFRGSEEHVLERYVKAATQYNANPIFRLTGDNPLMDPSLLHAALDLYHYSGGERTYVASGISQSFPLGISCELFSQQLLQEAYLNASTPAENEHVTPYMHQNKPGNIRIIPLAGPCKRYHYRLTVDTPDDFELHRILIEQYHADILNVVEIIRIMDDHPELQKINSAIIQKPIS